MSNNCDTVRAAHDAFLDRDFKKAATTVLARDGRFVDHARGETYDGVDDFVTWVESHVVGSSDITLTERRYIDAGDWVIALFTGDGTHDGNMGGIPATGRRFTMDICELWRFEDDGLAHEGHSFSDALSVMGQLGLVDLEI